MGEGVKATAFSEDGIIEAIELDNNKNVFGVQWHPEDLTRSYPEFRALFGHLIELALDRMEFPPMYYI